MLFVTLIFQSEILQNKDFEEVEEIVRDMITAFRFHMIRQQV